MKRSEIRGHTTEDPGCRYVALRTSRTSRATFTAPLLQPVVLLRRSIRFINRILQSVLRKLVLRRLQQINPCIITDKQKIKKHIRTLIPECFLKRRVRLSPVSAIRVRKT
jgi:hypothetical protein